MRLFLSSSLSLLPFLVRSVLRNVIFRLISRDRKGPLSPDGRECACLSRERTTYDRIVCYRLSDLLVRFKFVFESLTIKGITGERLKGPFLYDLLCDL